MGILGEENLYLLDATLDTWYSVAGAAMFFFAASKALY